MSNITDIIDKVKRLQALSCSSNANEAAAAAAAANKLIDKYRLEAADLEVEDSTQNEAIENDSDYIYTSGRITVWRISLIKVLSIHYGVANFNDVSRESGRKVSRYRLVGRRSDIGIVRYMFSWLTSECERLARIEAYGMGKIFVASYCDGFVDGIATQLKLSRQQVRTEATSTAMVRIDARLQESMQGMYRLNKNLRMSKTVSHAHTDRMAFAAGQQRGQSTHLGASLGSGGTKLLNG